jgi:tetratricopeptide (TPR) repeat protein
VSLMGGHDSAAQVAQTGSAAPAIEAPTPAPAPATTPAPAAPIEATTRVETPAVTPQNPTQRPIAPPKRVSHPMVVEYDTPRHEVAVAVPANPTTEPEDTTLVQARAAYAVGNQHLFAGDASGAIHQYQQALSIYPGYIAGYRGLGLAYDQLGDKSRALQALRTYVGSAPGAKDIALIKKRIARLQAK